MMLAVLAFAAVAGTGPGGAALAQPTAAQHEIPQSQVLEHEETLHKLTTLAARPGGVGVAAHRALELYSRHTQREREYILPPLTLLPDLADGKVTPDMQWALDMADRVKADREIIFQEHAAVTDALNALMTAGLRAHDHEAVEVARAAAADSLNDIEIMEPTVVMIGDVLRGRLARGHN
jgi:hypothetical protein